MSFFFSSSLVLRLKEKEKNDNNFDCRVKREIRFEDLRLNLLWYKGEFDFNSNWFKSFHIIHILSSFLADLRGDFALVSLSGKSRVKHAAKCIQFEAGHLCSNACPSHGHKPPRVSDFGYVRWDHPNCQQLIFIKLIVRACANFAFLAVADRSNAKYYFSPLSNSVSSKQIAMNIENEQTHFLFSRYLPAAGT